MASWSSSSDLVGRIWRVLGFLFFTTLLWWQELLYVGMQISEISENKAEIWSFSVWLAWCGTGRLSLSFSDQLPRWKAKEKILKAGSFNKHGSLLIWSQVLVLEAFGGSVLLSGGALLFSFSRRGGVRRKKQARLSHCGIELLRSWGTAKYRRTLSAAVVCQPTQMASRWHALTPASFPGVLSTSLERPSSEFAVALHVESETSGLVPVSVAGGYSWDSNFIGGGRGGPDGFSLSSCRVFYAKVWDCFVIFILQHVPHVNYSCSALI